MAVRGQLYNTLHSLLKMITNRKAVWEHVAHMWSNPDEYPDYSFDRGLCLTLIELGNREVIHDVMLDALSKEVWLFVQDQGAAGNGEPTGHMGYVDPVPAHLPEHERQDARNVRSMFCTLLSLLTPADLVNRDYLFSE